MRNGWRTNLLLIVLLAVLGGALLAACVPASSDSAEAGQAATPTASMVQVESDPLMAYPGSEWTVVAHLTPEVSDPMPPTPTKYPGYPAPPTPTQPPPPSPRPTPRPEDPWGVTVWVEVDMLPQYVAEEAKVIVVGEVARVFPARWTTPDGKRPLNPHLSSTDDVADYFIYTPVEVSVTQYLKGEMAEQTLFIRVPGRRVGEDEGNYFPEELFVYKEVEQVVLFLGEPRYKFDQMVLYEPLDRYLITSDGIAQNSFYTFPFEELITTIADAV